MNKFNTTIFMSMLIYLAPHASQLLSDSSDNCQNNNNVVDQTQENNCFYLSEIPKNSLIAGSAHNNIREHYNKYYNQFLNHYSCKYLFQYEPKDQQLKLVKGYIREFENNYIIIPKGIANLIFRLFYAASALSKGMKDDKSKILNILNQPTKLDITTIKRSSNDPIYLVQFFQCISVNEEKEVSKEEANELKKSLFLMMAEVYSKLKNYSCLELKETFIVALMKVIHANDDKEQKEKAGQKKEKISPDLKLLNQVRPDTNNLEIYNQFQLLIESAHYVKNNWHGILNMIKAPKEKKAPIKSDYTCYIL